MLSVYHPTRTIARRVPLPRVITLRLPPQLFTQGLTAGLSFVGSFARSRLFLRNFSATLNPSAGGYPSSSLISYWKLDEASGNRLDSAGGNNLTDNNSVGSTAGIIGNATVFVSANSKYLSCASNSTLQMSGNTDFTIAAWVKLTSLPGGTNAYSLVTKDSNAANSRDYTLDFQNGHGFRFYIQGGATYMVDPLSSAEVINTWYFVVAWYDSSNGQLHLRLNDTTTYNSATGSTGTDISAAQFRIGARQYSGFEDYSDATIDEVGLWKRKLTAGEITALYNGGAGITYTGAPAVSLRLKTLKALAATFSPVAALSRTLARSLTATLTFTAALTKKYLNAGFTATLSFIGNLAVSKTFVRALTATLSFTGSLSRRTGKVLSATLSFTGAIAKNIRKTLSATLSFIGNLAISKLFVRAFTATLSFTGNLAVSKLFVRVLTATLSFTGTLGRRIGKSLSATLSFIGNLAESFIAGGGHVFTQSYAATLSFVGAFSVSKSFLKAFTATLSFTGALSRRAGKAFNAILNSSASLVRRAARAFSATLTSVGTLVKVIRDAGFSATLSFLGSLTTAAVHFFTRSFTAALSFTGNLARSRMFARTLIATLSMSGALRRQLGKSLAATLSFSGALRKAIRKSFAAVLSFIVFFFKGGAIEILAGIITKAGALIGLAGSTARIGKAGSQLDVREAESGAEIPATGSQLRVERTK